MDPRAWYENLLRSITDQDVQRVGKILLDHIGEENAISLASLARGAFGKFDGATERKTRVILERLATQHRLPVGAHSGKPGRWLCASEAETQKVIADLEARKRALDERVRALRSAAAPLPEEKQNSKIIQSSLF